jgi:hypothetical protein
VDFLPGSGSLVLNPQFSTLSQQAIKVVMRGTFYFNSSTFIYISRNKFFVAEDKTYKLECFLG